MLQCAKSLFFVSHHRPTK